MNKKINNVVAMFVVAVMFFASAPHAQTSPSLVDRNVNLAPGDSVTVNCPDSTLERNTTSANVWKIVCRALATLTPTATTTQTASPTQTHSPTPTSTNTSTPTQPVPTSSPTATSTGNIPPFASAPLCATHDPMIYHGLWNYSGCHYDHEHGFDVANMGEQYFGEWGSLWGGEWMYPFTSSALENQPAPAGKHPGMKGVYNDQSMSMPPCGKWDAYDGGISDNCIVAVRGLIHILGSVYDHSTPFHTGFLEYYVCKKDKSACGIVRIGGLIDWGGVQSEPYGPARYRPVQNYDQPTFTLDFGPGIGRGITATIPYFDKHYNSGEPYIFGRLYQDWAVPQYRAGIVNPTDTWSGNDFDCNPLAGVPCTDGLNAYYRILYAVADAWTLVDPVDMRNIHWLCEEGKPCTFNGSYTGINEAGIKVLSSMDGLDGAVDGFVTWRGWSDRYGTPLLNSSCVTASLNCVPMEFVNAPVGVASMKTSDECECFYQEHDIYFNGTPSDWIKFPN